ncbi:acyl-CoA carboxylase epsilon subunit [Streptomyces sp. NPDC093586]|uniref:acyl-CoA carboxylase epsilon subunit n=1 Tax=Streptomyces sp. NPDC093586 TaxID=3366042 RepID=UPI00381B30E9
MSHDEFLRIRKGQAGPEELAALTAVLLARAAAGRTRRRPPARPPAVRWRRPEHRPHYASPHSWQVSA